MKNMFEDIKNGALCLFKTDTLYGICTSAFSSRSVENIYKLKKRDFSKPVIVLISKISDLKSFGVEVQELDISNYWPGAVSILFSVLGSNLEKFEYIHRGSGKIAFRLPDDRRVLDFLDKTGPLVAPSANIQGGEPAKNIIQAKEYFFENIDYYIDDGECTNTKPSKLIEISSFGNIKILRK